LIKTEGARKAQLAGHRDRPRGNLAAAPALRRSRRAFAQAGSKTPSISGDGTKVTSNGQLVEALAACCQSARAAGIASPAEARKIFGTRH